MENKGLTLSIIFEAESSNYGEGGSNYSSLKKMNRGDGYTYSYISRQALRYSIIKQLGWDTTPVEAAGSGDKKVVQFKPDAYINKHPEIDLFGYMKTIKGGASIIRSAVVRLSNAISLENYNADTDFLNNMGLAKRANVNNNLAQIEIHKSYYAYTITIDLDRVGIDEIILDKKGKDAEKKPIEIEKLERAKRVKDLLKILKTLYRDIRGRRENLSPIFIIGGVYNIKNPFFENRLKVEKNRLAVDTIKDTLKMDEEISKNTICGLIDSIFSNTEEIKKELNPKSIAEVVEELCKKVDEYYV